GVRNMSDFRTPLTLRQAAMMSGNAVFGTSVVTINLDNLSASLQVSGKKFFEMCLGFSHIVFIQAIKKLKRIVQFIYF
ncbi:MAG: hypothetical protein JW915_23085, partial [Chitinispirillaceae bacterium]|nr:hypothetical protein [Chitinispirillaceae bacterium]